MKRCSFRCIDSFLPFASLSLATLFVGVQNVPPAMGQEKPQITRWMPSGATLGQSSTVEAIGTFKDWPVQIWCSHPSIEWSCAEKPGVFQVKVPSDIPSSVVWVRLYNSTGATAAKPFMVFQEPVAVEKEPNDVPTSVTDNLPEGRRAFGVLERNVDVDIFRVDLPADTIVSASIDATRSLRSPLDAQLQWLDARGFVVAENMEHYGYDPAIQFQTKKGGTYFLRVFGFPVEPDSTIAFHGGADRCYSLCWQSKPLEWQIYTPSGWILFSKDQIATAATERAQSEAFSLPFAKIGCIANAKQKNYYRIPKEPGKLLEFTMHSQDMGSDLDPHLAIVNADDQQVVAGDDDAISRNPKLQWTIPAEGDFWVVVSDFHRRGGRNHTYHLAVQERKPTLHPTAPTDLQESKVGEEFEWSIAIDRVANWTGTVEVKSVGLPADTTLTNSTFTFDKEAPKSLPVKVKFGSPYQGPFRLQLILSGEEPPIEISTTAPTVPWIRVIP